MVADDRPAQGYELLQPGLARGDRLPVEPVAELGVQKLKGSAIGSIRAHPQGDGGNVIDACVTVPDPSFFLKQKKTFSKSKIIGTYFENGLFRGIAVSSLPARCGHGHGTGVVDLSDCGPPLQNVNLASSRICHRRACLERERRHRCKCVVIIHSKSQLTPFKRSSSCLVSSVGVISSAKRDPVFSVHSSHDSNWREN